MDDDPIMAQQNPALLSDTLHNRLGLTFSNYLADINYGYAGYARSFPKLGVFHAAVQFVNYGELTYRDETGNDQGTFKAAEWMAMLGMAKQIKGISLGANIKWIFSQLAPEYTSQGLALDLGAAYQSKNKLFSAGISAKNLGIQLTPYANAADTEPLPFELVAGISQKLQYMPFRFSLTFIQLQQAQLIYQDPNEEQEFDLNNNPIDNDPKFSDKVFRHLVLGGELLLGNALRIRGGYNHMRRQELRSELRGGLSGFSLGAGIRTRRVHLDYGFAGYGSNAQFATHQFTLSLRLGSLPSS